MRASKRWWIRGCLLRLQGGIHRKGLWILNYRMLNLEVGCGGAKAEANPNREGTLPHQETAENENDEV